MRTYNIKVSKYFTEKAKLGEVLHKATGLDFPILADASAKGAVWHQKNGKGKILKVRSTHVLIEPNDQLTFYYDPRVLSLPEVTEAVCVHESTHYGVWIKPAGVMPQGSQTGDHTSLLRYVEKLRKKEVYLIHRLDRETEGLMLIGYTSEGAGKLSQLFLQNKVKKIYQAIVLGELERGHRQTINASLDGKEAVTHIESLKNHEGKTLLQVEIETGRLHQIRRHLDFIGHPVIGDPKYGKGNKNRQGLQLLAKSLSLMDPWTRQTMVFSLPASLTLGAV